MTPPLERKNPVEYHRIVVVFYSAPKVFYRIAKQASKQASSKVRLSPEYYRILQYSIVILQYSIVILQNTIVILQNTLTLFCFLQNTTSVLWEENRQSNLATCLLTCLLGNSVEYFRCTIEYYNYSIVFYRIFFLRLESLFKHLTF